MPFTPRCVLEVADCDPDYEGPLDDLDWSLCTLVLEKPECANICMVSDGDIVRNVPLRFLREPQELTRKRDRTRSYIEDEPQQSAHVLRAPSPARASSQRSRAQSGVGTTLLSGA